MSPIPNERTWTVVGEDPLIVRARLEAAEAEVGRLREALSDCVLALSIYVRAVEGERHAKTTIKGEGYTASSSAAGRLMIEQVAALSPRGDDAV